MTQTGSRPRLLSVGNVLLVCKDAEAIRLLTEAAQQFALSLDVHHQAETAASILGRQKFEAVVVDLELGDSAKTVAISDFHWRFRRSSERRRVRKLNPRP